MVSAFIHSSHYAWLVKLFYRLHRINNEFSITIVAEDREDHHHKYELVFI